MELKSLTPVKEEDQAGLISMITVIEHCWLDLQRLNLEGNEHLNDDNHC